MQTASTYPCIGEATLLKGKAKLQKLAVLMCVMGLSYRGIAALLSVFGVWIDGSRIRVVQKNREEYGLVKSRHSHRFSLTNFGTDIVL